MTMTENTVAYTSTKPTLPKVTVLIAVHNAEEWLRECLDSLVAQTMTSFEAICIDDYSKDSSLNILKEYQSADKRFSVIPLTENHGQAYARNRGLSVAQGKYTCFLDSDDFFSSDALEKAVETIERKNNEGMEENDCVMFRVVNFTDSLEKSQYDYPGQPFSRMSGKEAFEKSLSWNIHGVYMVRTSIHKAHPYDETCRVYSDDNTTRLHYLSSRHVDYCEGVYFYRQHPASSTHAINASRFDVLRANESMKRQLIGLMTPNDIIIRYENIRWLNLIGTYMFYFKNRRKLGEKTAENGLKEIKRVWMTIEMNMLCRSIASKFGYIPFRRNNNKETIDSTNAVFSSTLFQWLLFRLQEEIYFCLRELKDIITNRKHSKQH